VQEGEYVPFPTTAFSTKAKTRGMFLRCKRQIAVALLKGKKAESPAQVAQMEKWRKGNQRR
jgi:hypothetical protein